jgi:hypothetical protein
MLSKIFYLSLIVGLCAGCHRRVYDPNSGRFVTSSTDVKSDQPQNPWYPEAIEVNGHLVQMECRYETRRDEKVCRFVQ